MNRRKYKCFQVELQHQTSLFTGLEAQSFIDPSEKHIQFYRASNAGLCNSYSTVARDLSLTRGRGRAVVINDKSHGCRAITILYPT